MSRQDQSTSGFPETFTFGVATADHQCEAHDPEREDIRDVWERTRGLTVRGRATDFGNRYPEDVELARKLGCTAFRFSISWSRVEPSPGVYDDAAFEHYRQVIATIRAAGMEPLVTLHHFTWPVHVEERGGMIADDFPAIFAHYAAEVSRRLGDQVRLWITFNEPTQLIYGYIKPWWEPEYFIPPGLPEGATLDEQMRAVGQLIRNLFLAHAAARTVIKRDHPEAQVGANPLLLGLPVWLQRLVDRNATKVRDPDDLIAQGRRFAERGLLESGEVDVVVATLTKTPERAEQIAFTDVYYVAGQRLLVRTTSAATGGLDLARGVVAVVRGSTAEHDLFTLIPGARPLAVDDYVAARAALDDGRADALLADDTILRGLMTRHPGQYRLLDGQLTDEPYAAAVAPGNRELFDAVDGAVRHFKSSGAWADSYARHLGEPVPAPPATPERTLAALSDAPLARVAEARLADHAQPLPLAPRGTALRRVQDRGFLLVAVKEDVPGFSYRDPATGEYQGFENDLAREMALVIFADPAKIRFRPATTRERIPLLRSIRRFLDPILKPLSVLSTVLTSNWWHLGMAGKLPEFLCPRRCVGQQDFVGFDYYWGISALRIDRIQRLIDAALGHFDRAPVWPGALNGILKYHAEMFPGQPIIIGENGSVDVADGVDRPTYIQRHMQEVERAIRDGVPVQAYMCWTIASNREWGHAFGPNSDFGLYHVDLDNDPDLKRVETPAVAVYQSIIAAAKGATSIARQIHPRRQPHPGAE